METKFVYDLILPFFAGEDDSRPALNYVHNAGNGYVYASEGHILIRVPVEKVTKQYGSIPGYPDAERVIQNAIDREGNRTATLETNDLMQALSRVAWRRVITADECPDCDGTGDIECEHCENKYDCKKCNGSGKVNIRVKEFSLPQSAENYGIEIARSTYKANFLQRIAIAAQMLQAEQITHRYRKAGEAGAFSFSGLDILLIPVCDPANAEIKIEEQ
jgi:hypothetical protein